MSVIAVTSSRTSPGATTVATGLALVWSRRFERSLLVEADPSGGVLGLRFGLAPSPSLATFGSDVRNGWTPDALWSNTQELRGTACLTAPVDGRLASAWIERSVPALAEQLPGIGVPVAVDVGQLNDASASLALCAAADTTLVVTRTEIAEVQSVLFQVRRLQALGANVELVTIGSTPNDPVEIAQLAGVRLAAVLPDDATTAAGLKGDDFNPGRFRRSLLWRTLDALASDLVDPAVIEERAARVAAVAAMPAATPEDVVSFAAVAEAMTPPPPSADAVRFDAPAPIAPAPAPTAPAAPAAPVTVAEVATPLAEAVPALAPAPAVLDTTPAPLPTPADATAHLFARLVLSDGSVHSLDAEQPVVLGRHRDCNVVVSDARISRQHVRIMRQQGRWFAEDLGSSNGTTHNGQRITTNELCTGDELVFGRTAARFELIDVGELTASYARNATTRPEIQNPEMECA